MLPVLQRGKLPARLVTPSRYLLALVMVLASGLCQAATPPFPLQPVDTSSPRATLQGFMQITSSALADYRSDVPAEEVIRQFSKAERYLDTSLLSPDRIQVVATEAGLLLYEVLSRLAELDWELVPDQAEVEHSGLKKWIVPQTEIVIQQVETGKRSGEFLFSPTTVQQALDFYQAVKHLPYATDLNPGNFEEYVNRPAIITPYHWLSSLPDWALSRVLRNPLWKWLSVILCLVGGCALIFRLNHTHHNWQQGRQLRTIERHGIRLLFALALLLLPLGVEYVVTRVIGLRFEAAAITSKLLYLGALVAGLYALYALITGIGELLVISGNRWGRGINVALARASSRLVALLACIGLLLGFSEFLGLHLTPVLAGLGIGGLAVALAARVTLENIIGGFTLFADKPIQIGDVCKFGDEVGTVEAIGLRSTRIRLPDDKLVSIPNADFSQMQLQNLSRIRQRLYRTTLHLHYNTSADQLRFFLATLREMLHRHPKVSSDRLHVRFVGFGDSALHVEVYARLDTADWLEFKAIREDLNLRTMDLMTAAGTEFAYPTQTTYLGRAIEPDSSKRQDAEAQVEQWRGADELPFPEFDESQLRQFDSPLDYPPKGSSQTKFPER